MSDTTAVLPVPAKHAEPTVVDRIVESVKDAAITSGNRAWLDLEPKIERGLLSGTFGTALVGYLSSVGIELPAVAAAAIGTAAFFLGGYLKSSNARGWKA